MAFEIEWLKGAQDEFNVQLFNLLLRSAPRDLTDLTDIFYNVTQKAAIKREATEVFRVATECGCGLTKGSESPLTTGASEARFDYPEREITRPKVKL